MVDILKTLIYWLRSSVVVPLCVVVHSVPIQTVLATIAASVLLKLMTMCLAMLLFDLVI